MGVWGGGGGGGGVGWKHLRAFFTIYLLSNPMELFGYFMSGRSRSQ